MVSDSIPNASIALSNPSDFAKKKRGNRTAKLKQCKLDARREQWLSQVKNKAEGKEEVNGGGVACSGSSGHLESLRSQKMGKLELKPRDEEESYGDGSSLHHFSDSESFPFNSPTSSAANFSVSSRSSSSSGRSSSSSCIGFGSGNFSEEDVGDAVDDDCLDDWEAMADALAASDSKQQEHSPNTECGSHSTMKNEISVEHGAQVEAEMPSANQPSGGAANRRDLVNCCAWMPDDAYRPQGLPHLSKQFSFPLNSERHFGRGSVWGCKNVGPTPKSCPICFEDLDCTDTSFFPCECGFRLCLFCHKRIIEDDGRCPGCRKQYEFKPVEGEAMLDGNSVSFRLSRSSSMSTRS